MDTQLALSGHRALRPLPQALKALALLLLCLLALPLGAFDWESASYALLSTERLLQQAADVTTVKYPDAETVQLDSATHIRYAADGTYFQVVDMAVKILTEKGVESSKVLTSYYNVSYARAKITQVEIIKHDGAVLPVDLALFTEDTTESGQMNSNIYDQNSRVIKVTVPSLEQGDILRAIYVDETLKPRVPDAFYDHIALEGTFPILHESIVIEGPAELPLKQMSVRNPIGAPPATSATEEDGRVRYTWEFANIPQAFSEPKMPPLYQCGQHLLVSTFASWQEVSKWYWALSVPHLQTDEAIRQKAAELTEGVSDFDGKVRVLFDFVSQQIRYMGVIAEDTAPGYEPHDVTRTFADRAGVCRDKAALLVAMLRAAGLEAFPVLIHTTTKKDPDVAMPYFNHAISAVQRPTGGYLLMDATAENTRDLLPGYLADRSYLVATPDGEGLMTTPVAPYTENLSRIRSSATLTEEGDLELRADILFSGIDDNAYRAYLISAKPEQRRQFFERQLSAALPGARLTSLKFFPQDLQDVTVPLRARLTAVAPEALITRQQEAAAAGERLALLRLPSLTGAFGLVDRVFASASLEQRRFPLQADFTIGLAEELTIDLPDNLQVRTLPEYALVDTPAMLFSREAEAQGSRLRFQSTVASKTMVYSPAQYLALKQALRQREADARKMPILAFVEPEEARDQEAASRQEDAPDAEILERDVAIYFEHENYWTATTKMRLKVLTYEGSRNYADLSFDYMPLCRTIDFKYARVINGNEVLTPDEKMVHTMDTGNGAAPRYPQEKRLVVNLPGVKEGSIIEYEIVTHNFNRILAGGEQLLQYDCPVRHGKLTINVPEQMDFDAEFLPNGWLGLPAEGPRAATPVKQDRVRDFDNRRVNYSWETHDMPACYREANLLPTYAYLPNVTYTCGSWKTYAKKVREAIERLGDGGDAVAQAVGRFDGLAEEERLRQLYLWFDLNIRQAGPAFTQMPLNSLSRPETTLTDRYGNNADRAILLAALLKAAGFKEVGLYLAANSPKHEDLQAYNLHHPTQDFFSRMLVRVVCNDREVWLNDQSRHLFFGTCGSDHGILLSVKDGGLSRMALPPPLAEHTLRELTLTLQDDGTARYAQRTSYYGTSYGSAKKHFAELRPEERRRAYQKTLASLSQNATPITKDYLTEFGGYPGTVFYAATIKDFAVVDGDYYYLRLPLSPAKCFPGTGTEERMTPLYWNGHTESMDTMTVELPPGFQEVAMMPATQIWRAPGGGGTVKWECHVVPATAEHGAQLAITLTQQLNPAAIRPANYAELRESARQMAHPGTATILLKRTETEKEE